MTKYFVEIPCVDSSLPWHNAQNFESKVEAIKYADNTLGSIDGWYSMMFFDGRYFIANTPNPAASTRSNKYLEIEAFHHKSDCLDFLEANFNADSQGRVNLIAQM